MLIQRYKKTKPKVSKKLYRGIYRNRFQESNKKKTNPFIEKKIKNVWGKDLTAELPTRPDILIKNDFKRSINLISKDLLREIKKYKS